MIPLLAKYIFIILYQFIFVWHTNVLMELARSQAASASKRFAAQLKELGDMGSLMVWEDQLR